MNDYRCHLYYQEKTKAQKKNFENWSRFYQEKFHIAKFRAEILARKKINKSFDK